MSNIVNIDEEHTQEIGNSLTDYYLYKEDKSQAYYFDIVRLMSMAKREVEMVDVFSSKFVIEAYVNGVELFELTSISNNIMKRLFLQEVIEYGNLQSLSTAILTIDKLEDTKYEISCVIDYIDYLKESIKRLELIDSYNMKMQNATKQKKRDYYKEGMVMLFQAGENFQNYHQILKEYRAALVIREKRIDDLYNEIKIIKKLKV